MKLGEFTTTSDTSVTQGKRDAFHVSCVMVTSEELLMPGSPVRFTDHTFTKVESASQLDRHGIIDPFISGLLAPGVVFWVVLMPGYTKNLVHHFDLNVPGLEERKPEANDIDPEWANDNECEGCFD